MAIGLERPSLESIRTGGRSSSLLVHCKLPASAPNAILYFTKLPGSCPSSPLVHNGRGADHQRGAAVLCDGRRRRRALASAAHKLPWGSALQAHAGGVHPGVAGVALQPEACARGMYGRPGGGGSDSPVSAGSITNWHMAQTAEYQKAVSPV